jgi:hypothetical protein
MINPYPVKYLIFVSPLICNIYVLRDFKVVSRSCPVSILICWTQFRSVRNPVLSYGITVPFSSLSGHQGVIILITGYR